MAERAVFLADVETRWSKILQAGETQGDAAARARNELLVRYHEAVQRFLRQALPDEHAADKVYSDFAIRVLEVDAFLKRADPERGRFRDYLKAVLRRMVIDHHRAAQRGKEKTPLLEGDDNEPIAPPQEPAEEDRRFLDCWRQELVNQAWKALAETEKKTGQPYATLLRLQEEQPTLRSADLAERLTAKLGRPFTADGVRQLVRRGRELFGSLLVQEVAKSLEISERSAENAQRIEREMIDLRLLFSYCKKALERYGDGG